MTFLPPLILDLEEKAKTNCFSSLFCSYISFTSSALKDTFLLQLLVEKGFNKGLPIPPFHLKSIFI